MFLLSSCLMLLRHSYNYVVEKGGCYLCVSTDGIAKRICFAYIERLKQEFEKKYRGNNTLAKEFSRFMESEKNFFSNNPEADQIRGIQAQVDQVKEIMMDNIEKVLARGEKLEDLDRKAEQLMNNTEVFHKKSKKLKCEMLKKNLKLIVILVVVILVILAIIGIVLYTQFK
eukprot:TRINITY_DN682_c0_g1_i3.p1 TRINITY_DN682_c0_g1~~TRINITY_DN682_c0_g1_i3.p1  ORF type:complete len:171 (-),score=53.65 TRINITY_DN682_c0_g1_i3:203-715(-)